MIRLIFFAILLISCASNNSDKYLLRVALVVNPRMDFMSPGQLDSILHIAKSLAEKSYSVRVEFSIVDTLTISEFFEPHLKGLKSDTFVINNSVEIGEASVNKLYNGFVKEYERLSTPVLKSSIKNQVNFDLIDIEVPRDSIIRQLAALHIKKLLKLKTLTLADNMPLIDSNGYNDFMSWYYIFNHSGKYHLIITNQLLASAEVLWPDVHASMRGGINSGFSIQSPNDLGGQIAVSTYPIFSDQSYFSKERGGRYTDTEKIESVAYIIAHELGHLLKYQSHYYNHKGCLMRPTPGLKYREWVSEIKKNGPCNKNHNTALKKYFSELKKITSGI